MPPAPAIQHGRRRLLGAMVLLAPCAQAALAVPEVQRETRVLLGTRVRMAVPGRAADLAPAMQEAWAEMARLEAMLSRYRAGSAVAQLARSAGQRPQTMPSELIDLLAQARSVSARSGGAFDVTVGAYSDWHFENAGGDTGARPEVPDARLLAGQSRLVGWRAIEIDGERVLLNRPGMKLDLGGIAKLPILEAGMQVLRRHGVRDALIDGGGDLRVTGHIDGRAWRIGLRDPADPREVLGYVELTDGWAASSGDYERCFVLDGRRYHHILDPRTGMPTRGVHGVSLVASDCRRINGLGAALMVRGVEAAGALLPGGVEAVARRADGSRWQTRGMEALLKPA